MLKPSNKNELKIDWTRINNDINGNPRYVCHFLNLLTKEQNADYSGFDFITRKYNNALINAKKLGGKKFHNKQFGGGIVFQCYNLNDLELSINQLLKGE